MKRLRANRQARQTDQLPSDQLPVNTSVLPIFRHTENLALLTRSMSGQTRWNYAFAGAPFVGLLGVCERTGRPASLGWDRLRILTVPVTTVQWVHPAGSKEISSGVE
ncbi:hypothetical protein CRM22_000297 [Opisthorchis felineus]|uniref:Uncharacterized protein n=1 Tax=Opisthorchis felineus TaxID=147828 RepID=A0A4S2MG09_OPIFE|nr:hypothetical protein CRM22_000297 [Opisthorchis felineus]